MLLQTIAQSAFSITSLYRNTLGSTYMPSTSSPQKHLRAYRFRDKPTPTDQTDTSQDQTSKAQQGPSLIHPQLREPTRPYVRCTFFPSYNEEKMNKAAEQWEYSTLSSKKLFEKDQPIQNDIKRQIPCADEIQQSSSPT